MGYSIDILNNIRANASTEFMERIPEATKQNLGEIGMALTTYTVLQNEFCEALINKIGKTLIETKLFENKLAVLKSGSILSQQDVEEIFIEMAKAESEYKADGPNPLGRRTPPDVHTLYHRQNRQDCYVISIGDIDFVRVFRSEATLDSFISGLVNSVYSGAAYDEYSFMKMVLQSRDDMFEYEVPIMAGDNAEASAKTFVKTVRKAVNDLSFASREYNHAGVMTWTDPDDMVLFIDKDVVAEVDVEVLAKAFNMGKTDIQTRVITIDGFFPGEGNPDEGGNMLDKYTYAILADKNYLRIWDTLSKMEPQRNAQGLFTNYFYHVHQILSISTFKNAVRFVANEPVGS